MSTKRDRPNSFTGLLTAAKTPLAPTSAPAVDASSAERVLPVETPATPVYTGEIAPILRDRKKRERLLSWTVRLPESLKARLERTAKKHEIEMTAIVVAGTRDYLDRYFPE